MADRSRVAIRSEIADNSHVPQPTSSAAVFFRDTFADPDPFARICSLVKTHAEENEWREFKSAAWFDVPGRKPAIVERHDGDLKKYWSENLSAFANTGDGILIWGIDAPNEKADKLSLPANAGSLASRLRDLLNNATDPLVPGVEIRIATKQKSASGFVVCLIPQSHYAPHNAKWAPGGYYMRGQSSNIQMRPEMLRRMFFPHTSPRLVPMVQLTAQDGLDAAIHVQLRVDLRNDGLASARDAFVAVKVTGDRVPEYRLNSRLWRQRYENVPGSTEYTCAVAIHPGETVLLLTNISNVSGYSDASCIQKPVQVNFRIFAEHAPALIAAVTFAPSEILGAYKARQPCTRRATVSEMTTLDE